MYTFVSNLTILILIELKYGGGSQTNIENIKLEILNKTKLNFFTTRKGKKYSM